MTFWATVIVIAVPTLAFAYVALRRPADRQWALKRWCVVMAIVLGVPATYRIIEHLVVR